MLPAAHLTHAVPFQPEPKLHPTSNCHTSLNCLLPDCTALPPYMNIDPDRASAAMAYCPRAPGVEDHAEPPSEPYTPIFPARLLPFTHAHWPMRVSKSQTSLSIPRGLNDQTQSMPRVCQAPTHWGIDRPVCSNAAKQNHVPGLWMNDGSMSPSRARHIGRGEHTEGPVRTLGLRWIARNEDPLIL